MDYKEEYQNALERAKKGLPIDEVFPELKESEDERINTSIKKALEFACAQNLIKYDDLEKMRDYLEKQKEQKPAEWSEEDDLMRDAILKTLERVGDYGTIGMQKDWLKSLRPQPHWKPSEEQMDALETAVSSLQSSALESLYNKLKKL